MPETAKRTHVSSRPGQPISPQKRKTTATGARFPSDPHGSTGKFEHTAAGKTRRNSW